MSDDVQQPERTEQDCRGEFRFQCGMRDCGKKFTGDDLARIARRGAKHYNKEHHSDLKHSYEKIDEVVFGGHHIQGHSYEVRKYPIYLTSFDIMDRLGAVDGRLVPADRETTCTECYHYIPDKDDRIEDDPDDPFNDEWICRACADEQEIDRKKSNNQQITEWCT